MDGWVIDRTGTRCKRLIAAMKKLTITDARKQLSRLAQEAAKGETFLITKRGVPVAELRPLEEPGRKRFKFGLMKGKVKFAGDFDDPLPDWLLDAFEGKSEP